MKLGKMMNYQNKNVVVREPTRAKKLYLSIKMNVLEDLKIGIKASIETEEDVKSKIKQKEFGKITDEVDDILDDI